MPGTSCLSLLYPCQHAEQAGHEWWKGPMCPSHWHASAGMNWDKDSALSPLQWAQILEPCLVNKKLGDSEWGSNPFSLGYIRANAGRGVKHMMAG